MNNETNKMYQVSTLQALAMGYSRSVVTVEELLNHGNIGLGTFENVDGEMITVDGRCFRALEDGAVVKADPSMGVPFAAVASASQTTSFEIDKMQNIDALKTLMTLKIEEDFGLNSMHVIRIDGYFNKVCARSESAYESQHVELKDILSKTQKDFIFNNIDGTLVCVYFPDYMDGINAPGWHLHFLSSDHTKGGHVFDIAMESGNAKLAKISLIEIQMPTEPSFDTYALKEASGSDIKKIEQGK